MKEMKLLGIMNTSTQEIKIQVFKKKGEEKYLVKAEKNGIAVIKDTVLTKTQFINLVKKRLITK